MASKVGIINNALISLGQETVSSVTQNIRTARLMVAQYDLVRKALLRLHPWSFAKSETALTLLTTSTANIPVLTDDFLYIFQLPPDFIKLLKTDVEASGYLHKIVGKRLYSNSNVINIEYIYDIEDPEQFDPDFTEAFSAKLAAELCYAITGEKTMIEIKWAEAKLKLNMAKSMNGQEISPPEPDNSEWLNSRT